MKPTLFKVKVSCRPNIGMWDVHPGAMTCNVGSVPSDFNLGERIWRSDAHRSNFMVHFEIGPLWASSPDTLPKIEI